MTGDDGSIMWLEHAFDAGTVKKNIIFNSFLGNQYVLADDEVQKVEYGFYLDSRVLDLVIGAKVDTL